MSEPSLDEDSQVRSLASSGNWEALCDLWLDRAAGHDSARARAALMANAAQVFARQMGDPERALVTAGAALEENPGDPAARALILDLAREGAKPAAAIDALERAIELAPQDVELRLQLAASFQTMGEDGEAVTQWRAALMFLQDDAQRADCLGHMAAAYKRLGKLHRASEALDALVKMRPDDPEALHEFLDVLTAAGDWTRAVEVLERLAETETGAARARYLWAGAKIAQRQLQAPAIAGPLYKRAVDADPGDAVLFERAGWALLEGGDARGLAQLYLRRLLRLSAWPPSAAPDAPNGRPQLAALWQGLSQLFQDRLEDPEAAAVALEAASYLAHTDAGADDIAVQYGERLLHR